MRFRLLGPLRVWDGAAWAQIRAAQQRAVLAILLIEAGRVVSTERLIDEIWGERPPRAAVGTVQGYVMRLRRLLVDGASLVTRGRGYELVVAEGDLDTVAFERLAEAGRRSLAEGRLDAAVAQLAEGLALWRGPALADVPAGRTVTTETVRLEQSRLTAVEGRLGAQLDLGLHADVVDELHRLVDEQPLRERLREHLMLALYRCGRRAEALDAYRQARRVLVEEFGLEPGQPLRDLQQAILVDDPRLAAPAATPAAAVEVTPVTRMVPAQLPADVAHFTGRAEHLGRLDALLSGPDPALVICMIAGTAGVGKTATAVHWAHRGADRFPDGQLYVNMRGYTAGPPLHPAEVLARFLHALGVPAPAVPADEDEAATLYRSLLAGKRMLILLDDVGHPDQVRPLLPGSPGCLVLVTSRDQLGGLVAREGAVRVSLDVLSDGDAQALLARLLGAARLEAEPAAVARLAALCGHLPLALRIAAANLTTHPGDTVASYTARLAAGDRLTALQIDGDPHATVRVAFDHSYAALPVDARRQFRLLGLIPGPHATVGSAAALADLPAGTALQLLGRLTGAHLVEESAPGRYTLHDLLRRYAAEQATAEESPAARRRLFDYYLRGVVAAAGQLYPQILRLPVPEDLPAHAAFADDVEASGWLDAELPNLTAAVVHAAAHGPRPVAWRLADALRGYLFLSMHTVDWQVMAQAALAAAEAEGDPRAQAAAHLSLASLDWAQGRHQQALDHHSTALALSRRAGWVAGESAALGNLGNLYWALGQLTEAVDHYTQALKINEQTGQLAAQATALGNLGLVHFGLGQLAQAADYYAGAIVLHRQTGSRSGEARILTHLGDAYHALGRLDEALETFTEAQQLVGAIGDRNVEGDTLRGLAQVHRDAGRETQALDLASAAVALARETGDQRLEAGSLTTRASVHRDLGLPQQAIEGHREALRLARTIGNRTIEIEALIGLAEAHHLAGQLDRAAGHARDALTTARQAGYRLHEGEALTTLAAIEVDHGQPDRGIVHATQAQAIHGQTGHRRGLARATLIAEQAQHDRRAGAPQPPPPPPSGRR